MSQFAMKEEMKVTMRRLDPVAVLLSALLLAGCEAGSATTKANEGKQASEDKQAGGILSALRPAVVPEPVIVPEGATLSLVLETSISSETSRPGDRVVARLAEDVRAGEKVVVPSGAEVRGRVTAAVPSGRVKTRARLAFAFDTLVLDGEHAIGTKAIDITAGDTHKKDAATIGIGAGAGAIVGAIAKGGKGAAIGTLIGGAAGTGVVLANTGKEVELGAGSRVIVRLTNEARL
jgi:hypothetical protein